MMPEPPPTPSTPFAALRPAAVPVQMLAYSIPARVGRPGILTAVGVMSIIVASLSGLSSLSGLAQAGMLLYLSSKTGPSATTTGSVMVVTAGSGTGTVSTTVSAGPGSAATQPASQPTTAPAGLTPAQIQTVIQRAQSATNNGLSPAQVTALQAALSNPSTPLVSPNYTYSPVQSATKMADGSVDVEFNGGGYITLGPAGQVSGQGVPGTRTMPGFFGISPAVGVLLGADGLASLALAVLLLVAGVLVFRGSQRAPRLHRIFAVCKIPVAVVGAAGTGMMYKQMMGPMGAAAGTPMTGVYAAMAFGSLLMACAYPVALLIVLRSRSIRAYYASAVAG